MLTPVTPDAAQQAVKAGYTVTVSITAIIVTPASGGCVDVTTTYTWSWVESGVPVSVSATTVDMKCGNSPQPTQPPNPTIPPPVPGVQNKLLTTTRATRQPYSSELSNILFDVLTGVYRATWAPTSPISSATFTYSNSPPVVYPDPLPAGTVLEVTSLADTGPWAVAGRSSGPSVPFNATAIAQATNNIIYVGTDNGVFSSEDLGQTFKFKNGPTGIIQLVTWNNFVFAVTYGDWAPTTPYPPVYIYMSSDNGVTWVKLYTKNTNQIGLDHITTPLVIPFSDAPVILDDTLYAITGLLEGAPTLIPNGTFQGNTLFTNNWGNEYASAQPCYAGRTQNGTQETHYISFNTLENGTLPFSKPYYQVGLLYEINSTGGLNYIGSTATGNTPVPGASPAPANYRNYSSSSLESLMSQPSMLYGTQIQLADGTVLAVPANVVLIQGGGTHSYNGIPA